MVSIVIVICNRLRHFQIIVTVIKNQLHGVVIVIYRLQIIQPRVATSQYYAQEKNISLLFRLNWKSKIYGY